MKRRLRGWWSYASISSCWEFSAWVSTWLAGASVSIRELLDERVALQTAWAVALERDRAAEALRVEEGFAPAVRRAPP